MEARAAVVLTLKAEDLEILSSKLNKRRGIQIHKSRGKKFPYFYHIKSLNSDMIPDFCLHCSGLCRISRCKYHLQILLPGLLDIPHFHNQKADVNILRIIQNDQRNF